MGQPRAASQGSLIETTRPNRLFTRLAEVLDLNDLATESLVADLLTYTDSTPITMTRAHLRVMRDGILEIIDAILPARLRGDARARLEALLDE
jgi:hypothetical protein